MEKGFWESREDDDIKGIIGGINMRLEDNDFFFFMRFWRKKVGVEKIFWSVGEGIIIRGKNFFDNLFVFKFSLFVKLL